MKKIAVLVPKGETMTSAVVAPYVVFTKANGFLESQGMSPVFDVRLIGCDRYPALEEGVFRVQPHASLARAAGFDLAIVPGFTGEVSTMLDNNQALIKWLKEQHEQYGTELASLCSGAFYIAATGLADGKRSTTHWAYAEEFQKRFPKVNLKPDCIVTDDSGIYASGGAYSSLNLVLYLLEKFADKSVAIWAAKVFQIDLHRSSQKPFMIFSNQKSHSDKAIAQVQLYMEQHFQQKLTIAQLAKRFAFSRRNFLRRFKEATGNTPIQYLQRLRIEAAKRQLETSQQSIEEIVNATGYSDSKTFRSLFRKYTGFSPMEYRNRYQVR